MSKPTNQPIKPELHPRHPKWWALKTAELAQLKKQNERGEL